MSASMLTFDVREIPFARRGSWFNLSPVIGKHQRAEQVHLVSHVTGLHPILELVPLRGGAPVEAAVSATESVLRWSSGSGCVEAAFEAPDVLRLRGSALGMRLRAVPAALTPFTGTYLITDPVDRALVLMSYETGRRYRITVLAGRAEVSGDGALGVADRSVALRLDDPWQIVIEEIGTARAPYRETRSFDDAVRGSGADFAEYRAAVASARSDGADKAAYVMWSATVRPGGFLGREAVLMSKHWMDKVWSWDHCFNALALAATDPGAALDQFLIPFDHQDPSGALPDSIAHSEVLYNFVKPPIHGWALRKLRERAPPLPRADLRVIHDRLARWTDFWLHSRRAPGRTLPHYQHGNDSGWDNSTTFDHDRVVESPDLAAFLVVQLDVLADLAAELGVAAAPWSEHARQVERALVSELWDGEHFVARSVATGEPSSTTSLINALPIVLGDRLDRRIAARLAATIQEHLTGWGLATELVSSTRYESDGYWRGPIWAPSTILIEDGVRRAGFSDLADTIGARFRALCERSGFAENFDAVTGDGLRDRAYTWTASAYLLLLADQAARDRIGASTPR
jgi:hypothetical protein